MAASLQYSFDHDQNYILDTIRHFRFNYMGPVIIKPVIYWL